MTTSKEIRDLKNELFGNDYMYQPPKKKAKHNNNKNENNNKNKRKKSKQVWQDPEDNHLTINIEKNRKLRHLRKDFNENEVNATEYIQRQRKQLVSFLFFLSLYLFYFFECERMHNLFFITHQKKTNSYQQSIDDDWTKDLEEEEEEEEEKGKNIQRSIRMTVSRNDMIGNNKIGFTDLGPINGLNKHKSIITVCEFHESGKILMIGGLDKSLCLYSMEGKNNQLLKKLFINDLPIRCAKFTKDGQEIFISGRRHFIYTFNLINFNLNRISKLIGRDERSWELFEISPNNLHIVFIGIRGNLIIVSKKTKKPIKTLSITGQITMIKFNYNGDKLYILTSNAIIYIFNMNTFKCINKILFDGIVKSTCFDIFESLNLIAIGCNSGVVSLYHYKFIHINYNENQLLLDNNNNNNNNNNNDGLVAIYNINNLITKINGIQFNHDGQLMVIWSKNKKQAIRLIHVETGKVYSNWPKDKGLSYVHKAKFSPNSGYLAIGNDRGCVKLIRLHFYGNL